MHFCLEAESKNTGIAYPHVENHKKESGYHETSCCVQLVTNEQTVETIKGARGPIKQLKL